MSLTIDDLQEVLEALNSASPKWFNLGLKLGLTKAFLTGLQSQYHMNNDTCLREMLAKVLETRHVTWRDLSDALRAPTVELNNLADTVAANAGCKDEVEDKAKAHSVKTSSSASATSSRPTMQGLRNIKLKDGKKIDLATEIGINYKKVGLMLLDSNAKVNNIEVNKRGVVEDIVDEILSEWLKGDGKTPVAWETLITVLKECGLKELAKDLFGAL